MTTSENTTRERRDWTLLIFIIPIGIILMLIAGQIAIRLVPNWSVDAGMQSKLDPNNLPMQQAGPVQPLLPAILTPFGWLDTFLTPGSDGYDIISEFIVLEPSATSTTPIPTLPTIVESPTAQATQTSATIVVSPPPVTVTKKPTNAATTTPVSTATIPPPTSTLVPTATTMPTATAIPTATIPPPPTEIATGVYVPPPTDLGVNTPPDGTSGDLIIGNYTIIDLGVLNSIHVSNTSDGNYDLILYEVTHPVSSYPLPIGSNVELDQIIVGISHYADGSYYEVFNWGDNVLDTNTNVNTNNLAPDPLCILDAPECDNRVIQTSDLYPSPAGTGILIDVDTASSTPPEGDYQYLVIISPVALGDTNAQVDSIQVAEVPIP